MKNALVNCGCMMTTTTSLIGIDEFISRETFEWMINEPLIVRSISVINRITCDMTGHEEETYIEFQKEITNAWNDINNALIFRPTEVPMFVLERVLNSAHVMDTLYREGDGYTNSKGNVKNMINLLLVESINV
ncbi:hypothetical protein H5410_032509 [Solanum commersonii]|uniref:Terpene synthase metal-binding domain-containing protein n=1 Tax=Solanum commersonii TaxID=4109 RepID=A0A9J5YK48_SOLCO|nr:hypothetical protein H5410_032509 [Solanum commersonii]